MDALSFDFMLPEYQDKAKDVEPPAPNPPSPPSSSEPVVTEDFDYEEEVGGVETVEVSQSAVPDVPETPKEALPVPSGSTSSSSNNSIQENNSLGGGTQSFYLPSVMSPSISYERDFPAQQLIAVFGRQFDRPDVISQRLQKLLSADDNAPTPSSKHRAKFLPFTMKRKALMKGTYSSAELKKHSLICMCYNASEARILLTGVDGFYSSLLRHVEAVLGSNKVAFVITNYNWPVEKHNRGLLSPNLKARLSSQDALRAYLENDQVFSWMDMPSKEQALRLVELSSLEANPQSLINQACVIL